MLTFHMFKDANVVAILGPSVNPVHNFYYYARVLLFFFFKILFIFLERGRGRGRKTSISCLSLATSRGPGPQPRHVPRLGLEPVTFQFVGQYSTHGATLARDTCYVFRKKQITSQNIQ